MKRIDARTIRYQLHRLFVTALLAVAALALLGKAAHAQPCASLAGVPDDLHDFYVAQLTPLLLPPDECSKIVKGALAACHKAVASTAGCHDSAHRGAFKAQKIACGVAMDPAQCAADRKSDLDTTLVGIEDFANLQHAVCEEEFALELYLDCLAI